MSPSFAYIILALIFVTWLTGCAATPPTVPAQVFIPVPVDCPRPEVPPRPALPLAELGDNPAPADVARAYAATVEVLAGYARELEALLSAGGRND